MKNISAEIANLLSKNEEPDLKEKKLVVSSLYDNCLFWVYSLTQNKELIFIDNNLIVFYSKKFDFWMVILLETKNNTNSIIDIIKKFLENKNKIHFILGDNSDNLILEFENKINNSNFNYSIINYSSEVSDDSYPFNLNLCKKVKYLFTNSQLNYLTRFNWYSENNNKLFIDNKYSFIYFYYFFGYNFSLKGENKIKNLERMNKVFLYTKNYSKEGLRFKFISMAIETNKIYTKNFEKEDYIMEHAFRDSFLRGISNLNDYNICKFNLVMESFDPKPFSNDVFTDIKFDNIQTFCTEKTLKALLCDTPSYCLLQVPIYKSLTNYGFYFLNEEFGKYTNYSWLKNYENFINFLKNSNEKEFQDLFELSFEKSRENRQKLESYIFSDKETEINLLINN